MYAENHPLFSPSTRHTYIHRCMTYICMLYASLDVGGGGEAEDGYGRPTRPSRPLQPCAQPTSTRYVYQVKSASTTVKQPDMIDSPKQATKLDHTHISTFPRCHSRRSKRAQQKRQRDDQPAPFLSSFPFFWWKLRAGTVRRENVPWGRVSGQPSLSLSPSPLFLSFFLLLFCVAYGP